MANYLPVACNSLNGTVVSAKRNVESNDSVAGLDELQVLVGDVCLGSCSVEEELDLLEETGLLELVQFGTKVGGVQGGLLCEAHGL